MALSGVARERSAAKGSRRTPKAEGEFLRLNRALRTLSAGNRMLLRASDEQELLHGMCRVIVEDGGYRVAGVGYARHDEQKTYSMVAYALPTPHERTEEEFLDGLQVTWADTEMGQHAQAIAVRTGRPCVGRNLFTDPEYALWREDAMRFGYASITAFPLRIKDEVIGALAMCATEADAFDEGEVSLLGELADDLAYGIANLRTRIKHREAEKTIERMAYYDELTGLPNRVSLCKQLAEALEAARQQFSPLALLVLKMGQLHEINETLGHREGLRFLQILHDRLLPLAADAMIARVGEDEFAVLLKDAGAERATRLAQDVLRILREPVELTEFAVDASASVGIALFPGHGNDAEELIRRATVAAGQARHTAAGQALYRGSPDREFSRRLSLMGELRHAIARNELLLYCQPKVDLESQRVCGAEALVRWQHPRHGMLSTGEFIKIAEHAGLITPLTQRSEE